eukprot:6491502-Amphidinium_carterae.1
MDQMSTSPSNSSHSNLHGATATWVSFDFAKTSCKDFSCIRSVTTVTPGAWSKSFSRTGIATPALAICPGHRVMIASVLLFWSSTGFVVFGLPLRLRTG